MSARKFWVNCREQGISLTLEEATELREKWLATFSEMKYHMNPAKARATSRVSQKFYGGPQDEDEDDDYGKREYMATLVNGMVRNQCSFCAALNVQFQGLTAYGVKLAMWNLIMAGFAPRLVNMIHDELLYCLWPEELASAIPVVEDCMIRGMRVATPLVKVGVETSCCLHWDKGAKEFSMLDKDENGNYIIEEPDFVRSVYAGG